MKSNKLQQTAQDWIEAHVSYNVYDDCDAMHELDKLASRFAALSDDKEDVEDYVKANMEKEYLKTVKSIVRRDGVYPDDLSGTPGTLLFGGAVS